MKILKSIAVLIMFMCLPGAATAQMEVMSYNIKYANENDGENSWSGRKAHLTAQLNFYEPEIFGVQEAVLEQLKHFENNLENYKYVGVGRDDGAEKGEFSAIFYKTTEFELLKEDTFWLSETPEKPVKGWDAALPRICTWALFQKKDSGEKFYVFNTHFDHVGEQAREESAKLIIHKIKEINKKGLPVILMGDLNLKPETKPIQFLSEQMNDSKKVAEKVVFGPEGTFNGYDFDKPVNDRIDYIFTNDDFRVLKYGVLSDSKDLRYPSDHLPVIVTLAIK